MTPYKSRYSFAVLALLCLVGCRSQRPPLPSDAPLIGKEALSSQEGLSGYGVMVPVCNRGPETLKAKLFVKGYGDEVLRPGVSSGFTAGTGSYLWFSLFHIKEERTKPIYVRIDWQHGKKNGVKRFVIAPEQTNITQVK